MRFNYQFSYLLCQARFSSSSDMLSICTIAADIEDPVFNKIIRCDYLSCSLTCPIGLKYSVILENAITIRLALIHKNVDLNDQDICLYKKNY